jgi:hypothetical protein
MTAMKFSGRNVLSTPPMPSAASGYWRHGEILGEERYPYIYPAKGPTGT